MSYSDHRPGRFGSEGQIEFEVANEHDEEPLYLQDLKDAELRAAEGEDPAQELRDAVKGIREARGTNDTEIFDFDDLDRELEQSSAGVQSPATSAMTQVIDSPTEVIDTATDALDILNVPRTAPAADQFETVTEQFAEPFTEPLVSQPAEEEPAPQPRLRRTQPRAQRRPFRRMAILGGADGPVIDAVPTETGRFIQMFFVLAGTALISGISMVFALTTGVKATIWLAIPLAIIWTLVIFNLDRFLTSTMKSSTKVWRLVALAIPRVVMAVIIGVVVAEPLVLQVFANDIEREVNATNIVQSQTDQTAMETSPEKIAFDSASTRLADLESQAATGVVTGTTTDSATLVAAQTKVDGINGQMTAQQLVIDQARAIYQCELTGQGAGLVDGCTGVSGEGSSSDAAKSQLDQSQATYDALAVELRAANTELTAAQESSTAATSANEDRNREVAKEQLPAAQLAYNSARDAYTARVDAVASGNAGASGLLSQITALNRLADKEPTLGWAHWMIAALFFMIELLPVLVKVLTSYGSPSLYEQTAAARRQVEYDRMTAEAFRQRAAIATA